MDPNLDMQFQNVPVSQEGPQYPPQDQEMDLWEAPFERWLRLADSLLGNITPIRPSTTRKI
jgi:hypothetical protein